VHLEQVNLKMALIGLEWIGMVRIGASSTAPDGNHGDNPKGQNDAANTKSHASVCR
jgi:hypothetical protein